MKCDVYKQSFPKDIVEEVAIVSETLYESKTSHEGFFLWDYGCFHKTSLLKVGQQERDTVLFAFTLSVYSEEDSVLFQTGPCVHKAQVKIEERNADPEKCENAPYSKAELVP